VRHKGREQHQYAAVSEGVASGMPLEMCSTRREEVLLLSHLLESIRRALVRVLCVGTGSWDMPPFPSTYSNSPVTLHTPPPFSLPSLSTEELVTGLPDGVTDDEPVYGVGVATAVGGLARSDPVKATSATTSPQLPSRERATKRKRIG
jgi:hypothetical protein